MFYAMIIVFSLKCCRQRTSGASVHFLPVNTMDLQFSVFGHILGRICRPPKTFDKFPKVHSCRYRNAPAEKHIAYSICINTIIQMKCLFYEKLSYLTKFPKHQFKKLAHLVILRVWWCRAPCSRGRRCSCRRPPSWWPRWWAWPQWCWAAPPTAPPRPRPPASWWPSHPRGSSPSCRCGTWF